MKPFWMIAVVHPVEGSRPQIYGPAVNSFAEACDLAKEWVATHGCVNSFAVILQAMASTSVSGTILRIRSCAQPEPDSEAEKQNTNTETRILRLQMALASVHRSLAIKGQISEIDRRILHGMVMSFPVEALEEPPPPPPPSPGRRT